jgi:hypothetical protein
MMQQKGIEESENGPEDRMLGLRTLSGELKYKTLEHELLFYSPAPPRRGRLK